jgi:hypothetical protein
VKTEVVGKGEAVRPPDPNKEVSVRTRILSGAAIGAIALVTVASPAVAATDGAKLSVLHGIPGLTVDVYVDNALTLDDFEPGDLAGPLDLPAGTYSVAITAADAPDASNPAIGPIDLTLAAGGNYTAVAHLTEAGQPGATLFSNDISRTAAGEGRLTVRHTAAAPAVDVLAGGSAVISGLSNPNEKVLNLPAGTVSAFVAAAGTTQPVIGPSDVNVAEGANTIVYAWGSLQSGNLALAVQTIEGLHSAPGGIPAGSAGLAAEGNSSALWFGLAGVLALLAGTVLLVRRRVAPVRE